MLLAEIHFPQKPSGGFSYLIPSEFNKTIPGVRVRVPFRTGFRLGFLVRTYLDVKYDYHRALAEVIDDTPIFSAEILELTKWVAEYYLCHWGEVLNSVIPNSLKPQNRISFRLSKVGKSEILAGEGDTPQANLWRALNVRWMNQRQIKNNFYHGLKFLKKYQAQGWIEVRQSTPRLAKKREDSLWKWKFDGSYSTAEEKLPKNARKIRRAVQILSENDGQMTGMQLKEIEAGLLPSMRSLEKKGWVTVENIPLSILSSVQFGIKYGDPTQISLNSKQEVVAQEIASAYTSNDPSQKKTFLLHGVTGSGKTLIYIEIVKQVIKDGKSVIIMIPEISLTPQLTGRFSRVFGNEVCLNHSQMSLAERREVWLKLQSGEFHIVIGPRSAVFAPVKDLGLIIVDEEHDDSYKQNDPNPRYSGRDTAIYRAKLSNSVVILGSATPDVSSYYNAKQHKYKLLTLDERYKGVKLPDIWVSKWGIGKEGTFFSRKMHSAVTQRLKDNEQIILLINRRGFSTTIVCPECGKSADCPNCDITLRYHRQGKYLQCHYCNHTEKAYDLCPSCRSFRLEYKGIGTQRIERELEILFPSAKTIRMDSDTTTVKGAYQRILSDFADRKYDILLGTQMVAKGHDFPGVTLVGILGADADLLRPDFRAAERAFRLLVQASGRAGRASFGEVVIQSWNPEIKFHRWIQNHDYISLYNEEIEARSSLSYPPFGKLIGVLIRGEDQEAVLQISRALKNSMQGLLSSATILGPAPPAIEKIEKMFRRRILIKLPPKLTQKIKGEKKILFELIENTRKSVSKEGVLIAIDVDPVEV